MMFGPSFGFDVQINLREMVQREDADHADDDGVSMTFTTVQS